MEVTNLDEEGESLDSSLAGEVCGQTPDGQLHRDGAVTWGPGHLELM
jgi:hypothetical protein